MTEKTVFWKQSTGTFNQGFAVGPEAGVYFCLATERFESGFHPLCKAHEKTDAAGTFSFKKSVFSNPR